MIEQVLIVGCGDTGRRVAGQWLARGAQVTGWVRTPASATRLQKLGAQSRVVDLDSQAPDPEPADIIYYFAPPPRQGTQDTRLDRFLAALGNHQPQRLVYISTSGVYGDCGGAWVDETRRVNPQTARAQRRVAAEQSLAAWNGDWVILRAPGIYGPGRLPLDKVRAGEPVLRDADCSWSNRIHIDDLAAIAVRAAEHGPCQYVYNATDGEPTKMAAYYRQIADLLGVAQPPQIDWATAQQEFSAMRLSFLSESRRLDNRRLLRELDMQLRYKRLGDGLAASIQISPD